MSRTYNENTTDAQKEDDYNGLTAYLDRAHVMREHDIAETWKPDDRVYIPRQDGTGETVTVTKITNWYVYFTTDSGMEAAISRGLLASLTAERERAEDG